MKKSIFLALILAGAFLTAQAQTTPTPNSTSQPTMSDYERMLQNQQKVEFRTQAVKALGLTEKQIMDFDPMYQSYMKDKNELAQKHIKLLNKYNVEIAETNSPSKLENEKEEFMEDYLELQVDEMKLRKETFDRMEDKITADKAFGFFLFEDMVANDIYRGIIQQRFAPFIIIEKDASMTNKGLHDQGMTSTNTTTTKKAIDRKYRTDIDAYSKWSMANKGDVGDPHNYTYNGLKSLTAAITSLSMACDVSDASLTTQQNKIMANAAEMQKDPKSMKHSALAKEAFIMTADMLKTVHQRCNMTTSNSSALAQLDEAARKIDASKTTTSQAQLFHSFFHKAQVAIDGMANSVTWSNQ